MSEKKTVRKDKGGTKNGVVILEHSFCFHAFQDRIYVKFMRVWNRGIMNNRPAICCTVCGFKVNE